MRWIDRIIDSMERDLRKLWEIVKDREAWHAAVYELQRVRHNLVTEQQNFCFLTRSGELKCVITNFLLCICTSYILLNKSTQQPQEVGVISSWCSCGKWKFREIKTLFKMKQLITDPRLLCLYVLLFLLPCCCLHLCCKESKD